jgi:hypothetical protein
VSQYNIAETVAELYKERVHMREVDRFRNAHKKVLSAIWNEFVSKMLPNLAGEWGLNEVKSFRFYDIFLFVEQSFNNTTYKSCIDITITIFKL